jgi:hypothetical protein
MYSGDEISVGVAGESSVGFGKAGMVRGEWILGLIE